jgi:hypothetical protein
MIVTTGNEIDGRAIVDYFGVVRGIVVRVPTRRQRIRGRTEALMEGDNNRYFLEVVEAARRSRRIHFIEPGSRCGRAVTPLGQSREYLGVVLDDPPNVGLDARACVTRRLERVEAIGQLHALVRGQLSTRDTMR